MALAITAPIRVPVNLIAKNQKGITLPKILITIGLIGTIVACAVLTSYGLRKAEVRSHNGIAFGSFAALYLIAIPFFRWCEKRASSTELPAELEKRELTPELVLVKNEFIREIDEGVHVGSDGRVRLGHVFYSELIQSALPFEEKLVLFDLIHVKAKSWHGLIMAASSYLYRYAGDKRYAGMNSDPDLVRNPSNRTAALDGLAYMISKIANDEEAKKALKIELGDGMMRGGALLRYQMRVSEDHDLLGSFFDILQPIFGDDYPLRREPTQEK